MRNYGRELAGSPTERDLVDAQGGQGEGYSRLMSTSHTPVHTAPPPAYYGPPLMQLPPSALPQPRMVLETDSLVAPVNNSLSVGRDGTGIRLNQATHPRLAQGDGRPRPAGQVHLLQRGGTDLFLSKGLLTIS